MYADVKDTIVAVSSAPGAAARGIVRISGPDAASIIGQLFSHQSSYDKPARLEGFRAYPGSIQLDDVHRAPAVAYVFRAPRSYTRQDLIELHTIGSPPILDMIVDRAQRLGARSAQPGEFTARSFLGGAITLTQAEAVAATINAQNTTQLRAARRLMHDHLGDQVRTWRENLTELLALVTADIDFAEEPIDFISPQALCDRIQSLRTQIDAIIRESDARHRIDATVRVQLLGPPNAGKSTLLNSLCGYDRAVTSPVSGVTRDLLTAAVKIGEREVEFIDAAGIDENPDPLISDGRRKALEHARDADVVCLVFDASDQTISPDDWINALIGSIDGPVVIAVNKIDLLDQRQTRRVVGQIANRHIGAVIPISAAAKIGLDQLKNAVLAALDASSTGGRGDVLTANHRQRLALTEARNALDRCYETAIQASSTLDVAELVAFDLTEAVDALGQLTGAVTTEDLLTRIFSSFCIGK